MDKSMLKYELIYKMTENGSKAEDFHKCCDDKGPTLTIIKTTSHRIFGGFTPLNWKGSFSKEDVGKRTFIFSLNLNKKFEIQNGNNYAIKSISTFGPTFGDEEIHFEKDLIIGKSSAKDKCTFLSRNNLELTNGIGDMNGLILMKLKFLKYIKNLNYI